MERLFTTKLTIKQIEKLKLMIFIFVTQEVNITTEQQMLQEQFVFLNNLKELKIFLRKY